MKRQERGGLARNALETRLGHGYRRALARPSQPVSNEIGQALASHDQSKLLPADMTEH
jgi:hypothetical protein